MTIDLMGDDWEKELMMETLKKGGKLRFKARGLSMLPSIFPGDVLTVETKDVEKIFIGDIIFFQSHNKFFVHRLLKKSKTNNQSYLITKGDYLSCPDNPIKPYQVLGKVTQIDRWGKAFDPDSRLLKHLSYILAKLFSCKAFILSSILKIKVLKI